MSRVPAYAAYQSKEPLKPFSIERRAARAEDVEIDIKYCGVCHSDIHLVRNEWSEGLFPMVPGHEIVGVVRSVGSAVTKFKPGQTVGVGCMVDSCRECSSCRDGLEQYCESGPTWSYGSLERDGKTVTYGGYSTRVVVQQDFVVSVSPKLSLQHAAPLLCAGITTYSPLRHWKVGPGQRVGVLGLGGLGHMAVKIAAAMGAEVSVLSSSPSKREDALRLGAKTFVLASDSAAMSAAKGSLDLIVNTVSAPHSVSTFLDLLHLDGTMVMVGIPDQPLALEPFSLIAKRRRIAGSLIGGIKETQEMLDFCAVKGVVSDIELIPIQQINEAYERMIKGDVRYRFVIDAASLEQQ